MRHVVIAIAIVTALSLPAFGSYTSTVVGSTATMTGNSSGFVGDIVVFTMSGGLLAHNRGLLDSGFNSQFDFDSTLAGDQTLAASAASTINVVTGSGPDQIQIGGAFASLSNPADTLLATFSVTNNSSNGSTLIVDNSLSSQSPTFLITATNISATGINVSNSGALPFGEILINGGSGDDTFNVQSVSSVDEPLVIAPGSGTNAVTIGSGGNLTGFASSITVSGSGNNTSLLINDSANASARSGTLSATQFTSAGLGAFTWNPAALSSLMLDLGSGADNISVTGAPANASTVVHGNIGADTFNVTVSGLLSNSITTLFGGADNDTFTVNAGAAAAGATLSIDGEAPTVAPGDVLDYVGAPGTINGSTITSPGNTPVTFTSIETITGVATHLAVSAPASAVIGTSFTFTVTALDDSSAVVPYSGTLHFTTTDGAAIPPADSLMPTGTGTFSATLNTLGSQTITATDTVTASITGTSNPINVTAAPATHFVLSAPASATAGASFTFTVTALDASNGTATGYSGTVHFTSSDGAAILPADATLVGGTGSFTATLNTSGNQTITATDTVTASITGTTAAIAVALAGSVPALSDLALLALVAALGLIAASKLRG